MHIVYYVTGHGYGHGVRACAVCNQFGDDVRVTFRTGLPEQLFRDEVAREFEYRCEELDCGCVQTDSVTVDIRETARRYMHIADTNAGRLDEHVEWTRRNRVDAIVSDITPFAFEVARNAGVASVAVSNFSWLDIYGPYVKTVPQFLPYVEHIERQHGMADLLLALQPQNELRGFRTRENMPPVGRIGRNRRDDICRHFGIAPEKGLALIYVGTLGFQTAAWDRLEHFTDWEFLCIQALPRRCANSHVVQKSDFRFEDVCASVDCVVSKLGYGVYAECLLNGVPLVFFPRLDFCEYPVLERSVLELGYGHRISRQAFLRLEWEETLNRIRRLDRPEPFGQNGTVPCARRIEWLARSARR